MTQPEYAYDAADFQPDEAVAGQCLFVCCYTDGGHAYPVSTIDAILAAGKGVLANHENATLELSGGFPSGVAAAGRALAAVQSWGMPGSGLLSIVFSCDSAVDVSQFGAYAAAFRGIRQVLAGRYLVGFYGELALYKYLRELSLVDVKCWLSASTSFPGYNASDPDVGLVQQIGSDIPDTDRNLVVDAMALGVWYPAGFTGGGTLITPTTGTTTEDEDEDMPIGLYVVMDEGTPGQNSWFIIGGNRIRCESITDANNAAVCTKPGGGNAAVWAAYSMTPEQLAAFPDITVEPK